MSEAKHDVEIVESQAEGLYKGRTRYLARCRTCSFESVWEWYRGDIEAIAERHVAVGGCER